MQKYKHIFIDIDRTMWDYETNARAALKDIYNQFLEGKTNAGFELFANEFMRYNELLWAKYRHGKIDKPALRDRRFYLSLKKIGITNNELACKLSAEYINISPDKTGLFPNVNETLQYLKEKGYRLHIITNGFNEVQFRKLRNSGIEQFFEKIVTSDNARSQKPHMQIFAHALNSVNAKKNESLMVGDDWELDILGAKAYGFDQVYFNPHGIKPKGNATYEIRDWSELRGIL